MDLLLEAAGALPLPWSCKTDCCGASLTLSRADVVTRLVDRLLAMAGEAGAECLVVACSMCQANLETRHSETVLPVFYVSELLGLALGLPGVSRWWKRHLIDPLPLLRARGLA
jgi:heterodisulfide reductase subunit B